MQGRRFAGSSDPIAPFPAVAIVPSRTCAQTDAPRPYADPYVAGVGLGVVLLAAFVLTGHGLGASGAFNSAAAGVVAAASPVRAADSPLFARYLGTESGPWRDWLILEIVGVFVGGALSALSARRFQWAVERGATATRRARLLTAFAGGSAMGLGAVLARGCTSGQALTGGALLAAGSWLFILAAFAAAYIVAPLVRVVWR
jgi:uncharacterized membrane protein YedE/YeeE